MDGATGTITPVTQGGHLLGHPIQVGQDLSPAVFSPDGKILAVIAYATGDLAAVDVAAGTVSQRIKVIGKYADAIAITPDDRTAYVATFLNNSVTPTTWPRAPRGRRSKSPAPGGRHHARRPHHVRSQRDLLCGLRCESPGLVIPITLATGQAGQPIPVGDHPITMAMSADGKRILVDNSEQGSVHDGSVTVIDTATNTAGKPLATSQVSRQAAFCPTARPRTSSTATREHSCRSTSRPRPWGSRSVGVVKQPSGPSATPSVAITPDGKTAYVLTPALTPSTAAW
jgi:DNA-binding beta-propeller fold protein YncE